MQKKLLLIVNPKAGKRRSRAWFFDVMAVFSQAGYLTCLRQTAGPGDAQRIAREEGAAYDRVVCCGGDGTLNQTVNGILELDAPPPVGYIACGSTNDFAASIHLPSEPAAAAGQIAASGGRQLDVGLFNDRHFMYVASFGAFTKVSYSAPQSTKNELGHLAYIIEGMKDLSTLRLYPARIEADGEVFEGRFLFGAIANTTSLGGVMKIRHDAVDMSDGLFELILVPEPKSPAVLNDMIRAVLLQEYSGRQGIIFRHVSDVVVESPEALDWSLDGESAMGYHRAEITALHKKLHMQV
jgi:YegS/Rv2252/BmrU family lipid kinase